MRIPEKGKAVQYSYKGSNYIGFSMGEADVDGLHISYDSDCTIYHLISSNWQEVEITPVVHVPEDMKPVYVWDDVKPTIPHLRISTGKINECGMLDCYIPTDKRQTAPWKHWEEL